MDHQTLLTDFVRQNIAPALREAPINIEKLFGQASARQYFRATLNADNEPLTYVIMKMPQGFASPAEEITKLKDGAPQEFPFLNVQAYLKKIDVPVPEVYGQDAENGLLLLQDLGGQSLEDVVSKTSGEFRLFYYKKVIDTLLHLQTQAQQNPDPKCLVNFREFNTDLLDWEFYHFLEYGIEDRKMMKVSDDERDAFRNAAHSISLIIQNMPKSFVHRDFQSRNLMMHGYEFYLIDFQDALTGPQLYDLVALLRDSYIALSEAELDALLEHYHAGLSENNFYKNKKEQLYRDFFLITLQRKLKDTGRFQFIHTVKGNSMFLEHVPTSLSHIQHAFSWLENNKSCLDNSLAEAVNELHKIVRDHLDEIN
ncbi:MAG: phosphotransferase [Deltaproteobacteria bacterium]|nr:phosphotransferase [Deltaproteobacteria bacterium]